MMVTVFLQNWLNMWLTYCFGHSDDPLAILGPCTFYFHSDLWFMSLILIPLGFTGFFQDIECVQVLLLLCAVGVQIVITVRKLSIQVDLAVVDLAEVGILPDIATIHPRMVVGGLVEGLAEGLAAEVLMDLDWVLALLGVMACLEIIQMSVQGKEIGFALTLGQSNFYIS